MEHPILKRKPNRKDNPLYGLNVRVARKLGKSVSLTYNETTLNMTSKLATVTTGVKRFFYSSPHGTVGVFATAKAGVATGDGSATAVFGGGGGIKVFLAGAANKFPFLKLFSTIPNSYVSGTVDIQQINGAGVSPTFGFAIGADFK